MTRSIELLKRTLFTLLASFFVVGLLFVVSCDSGGDEDPEPELYDLSGVYTFKEATLQTDVTINLGIPITVAEAGDDITDEISGGLLAEANCKDADDGGVELKSNFELFYTCIVEDMETKAGGWTVNGDTTELNLNLAAPPLPAAIQLKIEDVVIDEIADVISGSIIDFPLTQELMAGFIPASVLEGKTQEEIDAILASLPAVIQIDIDIAFQKVTTP